MVFDFHYLNRTREPKLEHEKAWNRAKATAWDERWAALPVEARKAYLLEVKPPTSEGSFTRPNIGVDKLPPRILEVLEKSGFIEIEPGKGKRPARIVATQGAHDFSTRLRGVNRSNLLGQPTSETIIKFFRYAYANNGETTMLRVLAEANVSDVFSLDGMVGIYVTSRRWPEWALKLCKAKAAEPVLKAIIAAPGPVPIAGLPKLIKGFDSKSVGQALTELIAHMAVFEDVDTNTFELVVGLLPKVRAGLIEAANSRTRPPLKPCAEPRQVAPPGAFDVDDLRGFLLEVAGEPPRLRVDQGIFAKEEPRFLAALAPRPAWLDDRLRSSPESRVSKADSLARTLRFVDVEVDEKALRLVVSSKGRSWLASGFEEQYGKVFEHYRSTAKPKPSAYRARYLDDFDDDFDDDYHEAYSSGDSKFLGLSVAIWPWKGKTRPHDFYGDSDPELREAMREVLRKVFASLPVGVFHRWADVLSHWCFERFNPLTLGQDPAKLSIAVDRCPIPRELPERLEQAGKTLLEGFLMRRLVPLEAVHVGLDEAGDLCVARLPRLEGYFGRPYDAGGTPGGSKTKVIVQPDFSVVVIGLDPGAAAELAPFCDRAGGRAAQGALTFKISRESVIRAASQGLDERAIIARLKKHASVDVPINVLREIEEWAGRIRMVNVKPITVVRCPDPATAARVAGLLGKKAERLGETMVALNEPALTTADRVKLKENGVLITKKDIDVTPTSQPAAKPAATGGTLVAAPAKKRGRPKKVR